MSVCAYASYEGCGELTFSIECTCGKELKLQIGSTGCFEFDEQCEHCDQVWAFRMVATPMGND